MCFKGIDDMEALKNYFGVEPAPASKRFSYDARAFQGDESGKLSLDSQFYMRRYT